MNDWKVEKDYLELIAEQRSDGWFAARKYRITASKYATLLGLSLQFETPNEAIKEILGLKAKKEPNKAMQLGTLNEDGIRKQFCKKYFVTTAIEPSLCLSLRWYDFPCSWNGNKMLSSIYPSMMTNIDHPNWFISGSPDGILYFCNGERTNMEIKFTKSIYDNLRRKTDGVFYGKYRYTNYDNKFLSKPFANLITKSGYISETGAVDCYPHVYISHLFQMQGCMHMTNVKKCAYVVGSLEKEMYAEIIHFDENLWRYYIYPELVRIIEMEIKPRMTTDMRNEFYNNVREMIELCKKNNATDSKIEFVI